jgi:hypothetical protein
METNIAGYLDVSDVDGTDPNTISVTLGSGSAALNSTGNDKVDELGRTGVSGVLVLGDTEDNDGDGDVPTPVVTLTLIDSSGTSIATTASDSTGSFTFSNDHGCCSGGHQQRQHRGGANHNDDLLSSSILPEML